MPGLDAVAARQADLSITADALKRKVERARNAVLILSIAGALAAAVAAATDLGEQPRIYVTSAGAALLAIAAALTQRYLGGDAVRRPVRIRAASEALKREAHLYAAGAGTYADAAERDESLAARLGAVNVEIADLIPLVRRNPDLGRSPRGSLDRKQYVDGRIKAQIGFYRSRAERYARISGKLHFAEWLLALAAAVITGLAGVFGRAEFDLAALTAVLTTIGGALLAHLQALKYDDLIIAYSAAAQQLEQLDASLRDADDVASIAQRAEAIIAEETGSWRAMFLR